VYIWEKAVKNAAWQDELDSVKSKEAFNLSGEEPSYIFNGVERIQVSGKQLIDRCYDAFIQRFSMFKGESELNVVSPQPRDDGRNAARPYMQGL